MMICRYNVKCDTCNEPFTLRISIGHSEMQEHIILCSKCGEEMIIALHLDQKKATVRIEYADNCSEIEKDGSIVNLHPEFIVPDELRNQDGASVSIMRSMELFQKVDRAKLEEIYNEENLETIGNNAYAIFQTDVEWKSLNKAWSQFNKENYSLANEIVNQNSKNFMIEGDTVEEWIFSFCQRLLSPNYTYLFADAIHVIAELRKEKPREFSRFLAYHNKELYLNNLKRNHEIFKEFYQVYNDMKAILLHFKINGNTPIDGDVSSFNFRKTKKLYGDIFESLTVNFSTLALISNIKKGRCFEHFEKMDINKYLTIDKAGRSKCFEDIKEFAAISNCLNSTIRNASHHASFDYNYRTGLIHYRSGGDGSKQTMSYVEYVRYCVSIFLSSVTMMCIEIMLQHIYDSYDRQTN